MHKKNIIYQIYPKSFNDSSGNGIGDLKGIIEKLDYLNSLNIDYIWISPFYKSPGKDNGYDISNYYEVDKQFGNKKDFINLIKESKKRNLKIMIDLVFNHTSTEHEWFKKWLNGNKKYKDFYISKYSENKPPNNWKSKFGGLAWKEYKKNNWYLCLFDKTQADLNWENSKVREKIYDVVKYYINLGVNGFRFDVINLISKNSYKNDFKGDGRRFYTNGNKFHEWMKELRNNFPKTNNFLTIGELSSTDIKNTIKCTNKNKTELDCAFTFHHLKVDYDGINKFNYKKPNIKLLNFLLKEWNEKIYETGSNVGFLNNHDQARSVSRFIKKKYIEQGAKMLYALISLLPGNTCLFQGEEINMENINFKNINDYRDIETINYLNKINATKIPKGVLQKSRDNARTPMQWDNSKYSGFSKIQPWIKVNGNYKKINVKIQTKNKNSTLNFYKKMNKFIKEDKIINFGKLHFNKFYNNVISYSRKFKNIEYLCVFNFNDFKLKYKYKNIIKTNYKSLKKNYLKPYQFLIIKKEK